MTTQNRARQVRFWRSPCASPFAHEWARAGVSDVVPKPVKLIPAPGAFAT